LSVRGCTVLSDSVDVEGAAIQLWLMQNVSQPIVFVGLQNYFAHYSIVFRKAKITTKAYIQVESDWAAPVLPLTETTPSTYRDPPHTTNFQGLLKKLRSIVSEGDAIVIDSLAPVFFLEDENPWLATFAFVNSLREIASTVIVSVSKDLGPEGQLFKQVADLYLELLPITSGFTQELSGQLVVSSRSAGILREEWTSYYKISEAGLVLIE